jgi:arylsulfatase A-like enzyme
LIIRVPGTPAGLRSHDLATTLDFLPTILNATRAALPPNLAGRSLLAQVAGQDGGAVSRLFAQNAHHHNACFDARFKAIAVPDERLEWRFSLYDRETDPGETRDAALANPQAMRTCRRELELSFDRAAKEWAVTRREISGEPPPKPIDCETCRQLAALGYVDVVGCDKC